MGKKKRKKFKTVSFKLSNRQMRSLKNYCDARQTTPTKLIKKMIRDYIEYFDKEVPEKYRGSHNQLDMFNEEAETLSMFE
jgi:hypothetical protein